MSQAATDPSRKGQGARVKRSAQRKLGGFGKMGVKEDERNEGRTKTANLIKFDLILNDPSTRPQTAQNPKRT